MDAPMTTHLVIRQHDPSCGQKKYASRLPDSQWTPQVRHEVEDLKRRGCSVKHIQGYLEKHYNFCPSYKQLRLKIAKWNAEKLTTNHAHHIVHTTRLGSPVTTAGVTHRAANPALQWFASTQSDICRIGQLIQTQIPPVGPSKIILRRPPRKCRNHGRRIHGSGIFYRNLKEERVFVLVAERIAILREWLQTPYMNMITMLWMISLCAELRIFTSAQSWPRFRDMSESQRHKDITFFLFNMLLTKLGIVWRRPVRTRHVLEAVHSVIKSCQSSADYDYRSLDLSILELELEPGCGDYILEYQPHGASISDGAQLDIGMR